MTKGDYARSAHITRGYVSGLFRECTACPAGGSGDASRVTAPAPL
jgi:hypothetical protein